MIYIRRFIDLMLISVIPSLIAELLLSQFPSSLTVYIIGTVFAVTCFYFADLLLLRRFIYDIKRRDLYFKVQIAAWALNSGLAFLLWYVRFGNALSCMYLPLRALEVLSINPVNQKPVIRTIVSMESMMAVNLILIFVMYPVFYKSKLAFNEAIRMDNQDEEISNEDIIKYSIRDLDEEEEPNHRHHSHHRHKVDDDTLISAKENQRLNQWEDIDENAIMRKSKKHLAERTRSNFWGFVLNLWPYTFYQMYMNKLEEGYDRIPLLKQLLRRKLAFFNFSSRRRGRGRRY